jgi:hypothetical protein
MHRCLVLVITDPSTCTCQSRERERERKGTWNGGTRSARTAARDSAELHHELSGEGRLAAIGVSEDDAPHVRLGMGQRTREPLALPPALHLSFASQLLDVGGEQAGIRAELRLTWLWLWDSAVPGGRDGCAAGKGTWRATARHRRPAGSRRGTSCRTGPRGLPRSMPARSTTPAHTVPTKRGRKTSVEGLD